MSRSDYQERREARIERYEERAAKARRESNQLWDRAHTMADAIPLGQPLLTDHYSYKRDRNYRDRIQNTYRRAYETDKKADHYAGKAAAAEANTAISSDDPEALDKLDARIAELEAERERRKTLNAEYRKAHRAELAALTPYGRSDAVPYPSYSLQNLGGNITRLKGRRAHLAARAVRIEDTDGVGREQTIGDVRIVEDLADNRTRIYFPGKPAEAIRARLKSYGFRWSPSAGAWQRQVSNGAWHWAEQVAREATS